MALPKIELPGMAFFTLMELAARWSADPSHVMHLIETKSLPFADKYAAIRGRRRTIYFPVFQPDLLTGRSSVLDEHRKSIYEDLDDEQVVLEVQMPDSAAHDQVEWDNQISLAKEQTSDASILVILRKDVEEFEEKHAICIPATPNYSESNAGPWPWGTHETTLLSKLAAAADKWWKNYDPGDRTTAPTNSQVTAWLKEQGVADRTASIMATILRADGLPSGPRT